MSILAGHHAVVTGGGSGMGRAMAVRLARAGARVSIVDLDRARAGAEATVRLAVEAGGEAASFYADVSSPDDVERAFTAAEERHGAVTLLAACAGIFLGGFLVDSGAFDQLRRTLAVNVEGVMLSNRRAARSMIAAGRGGRIVNWSSGAGRQTPRGYFAYSASKAAVESMTKTFAVELAPYGITVNAVAPGPVRTPMVGAGPDTDIRRPDLPLGRMAEPDEVAAVAAFLFSDDAAYLTGTVVNVDGGQDVARGSWSVEVAIERMARLHGRPAVPPGEA